MPSLKDLLFKQTTVPLSNETKDVTTVQTWTVSWYSRHGEYSSDTTRQFECFVTEADAFAFRDSLVAAFKLIRHTSGNKVTVTKNT